MVWGRKRGGSYEDLEGVIALEIAGEDWFKHKLKSLVPKLKLHTQNLGSNIYNKNQILIYSADPPIF